MIAPASLKLEAAIALDRGKRAPLRGMIAPASLKQQSYITVRIRARMSTPGHDCPGLIEAGIITLLTPGISLVPLRGMIAPASLKRGLAREVPQGGRGHSGA